MSAGVRGTRSLLPGTVPSGRFLATAAFVELKPTATVWTMNIKQTIRAARTYGWLHLINKPEYHVVGHRDAGGTIHGSNLRFHLRPQREEVELSPSGLLEGSLCTDARCCEFYPYESRQFSGLTNIVRVEKHYRAAVRSVERGDVITKQVGHIRELKSALATRPDKPTGDAAWDAVCTEAVERGKHFVGQWETVPAAAADRDLAYAKYAPWSPPENADPGLLMPVLLTTQQVESLPLALQDDWLCVSIARRGSRLACVVPFWLGLRLWGGVKGFAEIHSQLIPCPGLTMAQVEERAAVWIATA